jgi:ornithine cyclodeaminase/alanine dehydrogenase-like protein (mu-crystallin family)
MLKYAFPSIQEVLAFDISENQLEVFRDHMQEKYRLNVTAVSDPKTVFQESELVITATSRQPEPMVRKSWLKPGGVYIGLESFRYWCEEALLSADKFVTDDWNQSLSFLRKTKHIKNTPRLYAELGDIITKAKPGRLSAEERIVCIFVGMALVDVALGSMMYKMAVERGIGNELLLS